MAISVELALNGTTDPRRRYVTWAPSPCTVRSPTPTARPVRFLSACATDGERTGRCSSARTRPARPRAPWRFSSPRTAPPQRCFVSAASDPPALPTGTLRSRCATGRRLQIGRNPSAHGPHPQERDPADRRRARRFLSAFAVLNNGLFHALRAVHTELTTDEAHGRQGFYPWHRAYLLDLERELQKIDPSVALPYWRFDQPAPGLFTTDYFGAPGPGGWVRASRLQPTGGMDHRAGRRHPSPMLFGAGSSAR